VRPFFMLSSLRTYLLDADASAYSFRHHPHATHEARLTRGMPFCPSSIAPIGQVSVSKVSGRLENRNTGGAPNMPREGGFCQNPSGTRARSSSSVILETTSAVLPRRPLPMRADAEELNGDQETLPPLAMSA
jgi:hypothetical protein